MKSNSEFVAYEYKSIMVKRASAAIYTDCLNNFGWELVDEEDYGFSSMLSSVAPAYSCVSAADSHEMVALKFKRNRRISNKPELDRLERQCEAALASIGGLERKNSAYTMGVSLGAGLVGTLLLSLAVYSFISSSIVVGVLLAALGVAGWGIGFFANRKIGRRRSAQSGPMVQTQLELVHTACEQAHALLAS